MKILMISGWKRSGKDTASLYIQNTYHFERRGFADALKDDIARFLGIRRSDMDDQQLKEKPILDRPVIATDNFARTIAQQLSGEFRTSDGEKCHSFQFVNNKLYGIECDGMVTFGTNLYWTPRAACIYIGSTMRTYDTDYWVKKALTNLDDYGRYVISDFRYKSEYDAVCKLVGKDLVKTMRINRFDTCDSTDDSERNLDDFEFDYVIENRSDIDEFKREIDRGLNGI